jgi:hypothetical protein
MYFIKEYSNSKIARKYFKKYKFFEWKTSFNIQNVIKIKWNKLYYKKIKRFQTLDLLFLNNKKIDFFKIWKQLKEIHFIGKKEWYIHWDFYLKNILKVWENYTIIDFEWPKDKENIDYYYKNNIYVDIWIFIMKTIWTQYLYKLYFTNFKNPILNFLKWYWEQLNKKLIIVYLVTEIKRDLEWRKRFNIFIYYFWKIYYIYIINKLKLWIK